MDTVLNVRSEKTLTIESMLRDGELSVSEIARINGVSRVRVRQIRSRLVTKLSLEEGGTSTPTPDVLQNPLESLSMKTLSIRLTPAVYKALMEATTISNSGSDELNTIEDYAGDVIMTHLQTLGLIRQNKRK